MSTELPTELLQAVLKEADRALRSNHVWLLKHEDLLRALAYSDVPTPERARWISSKNTPHWYEAVLERLLDWGDEVDWFTVPGHGIVSLDIVCDAVGAESDAARRVRSELFDLPVPPARVYHGARRMGARTQRGRRPPQGW